MNINESWIWPVSWQCFVLAVSAIVSGEVLRMSESAEVSELDWQ